MPRPCSGEQDSQLQSALETRVVIEQAIGMLAERFDLPFEGHSSCYKPEHATRDSKYEPSRRS
jgi:hypothetical protein